PPKLRVRAVEPHAHAMRLERRAFENPSDLALAHPNARLALERVREHAQRPDLPERRLVLVDPLACKLDELVVRSDRNARRPARPWCVVERLDLRPPQPSRAPFPHRLLGASQFPRRGRDAPARCREQDDPRTEHVALRGLGRTSTLLESLSLR